MSFSHAVSRNLVAVSLLVMSIAALAGCAAEATAETAEAVATSASGVDWPPVVGERYPDLELLDQEGNRVRLSQFEGKVILLEPIGMSCPACQAFAGANRADGGRPYEGVRPQPGLKSIEEYARRYAGVGLDHPDLVFVQLLLYDMSASRAPRPEDARRWAAHFGLDRSRRQVVLAGTQDLVGRESYDMIPGFQLISRDFVLRVDSTGHRPRHDLYKELLPELGRLLRTRPASARGLPGG